MKLRLVLQLIYIAAGVLGAEASARGNLSIDNAGGDGVNLSYDISSVTLDAGVTAALTVPEGLGWIIVTRLLALHSIGFQRISQGKRCSSRQPLDGRWAASAVFGQSLWTASRVLGPLTGPRVIPGPQRLLSSARTLFHTS